MSDSNEEKKNAGFDTAITASLDTTKKGRYIPYSGGSMGWFENRGVLKSELKNNYKLARAMDSEYVRSALFQRWGSASGKRSSARVARENSINLLMSDSSILETAFKLESQGEIYSGLTRDISHYGMRLQFIENVNFSKGDTVKIQLLHATGETMLEVDSNVVWIKKEGIRRQVSFVGIAFTDITEETEKILSELL